MISVCLFFTQFILETVERNILVRRLLQVSNGDVYVYWVIVGIKKEGMMVLLKLKQRKRRIKW